MIDKYKLPFVSQRHRISEHQYSRIHNFHPSGRAFLFELLCHADGRAIPDDTCQSTAFDPPNKCTNTSPHFAPHSLYM